MLLLLTGTTIKTERSDEALRLCERVAESVGARSGDKGPAAWARALYAATYARLWLTLSEGVGKKRDPAALAQLAQRGRSDGLSGYAGKTMFALWSTHPDADVQLYLAPPSQPKGDGDRATLQGGAVGIEAQRYQQLEADALTVIVRRPGALLPGASFSGEVLVLLDEGLPSQRLRRAKVKLDATTREVRLILKDGELR